MIVTCPTCANRYSIKDHVLGDGKMVRCSICGTTWQQEAEAETDVGTEVETPVQPAPKPKKNSKMQWMFFFVVAFSTIIYMLLSTNYIAGFPANLKNAISSITGSEPKEQFKLSDVSHYFIKRDDGLYLSVTGSIENVSQSTVSVPYLSINLRTYGEEFANYENPDMFINETWAEKLDIKTMEAKKKIVFETEPRKVPMHDLMCTIKVGKNI